MVPDTAAGQGAARRIALDCRVAQAAFAAVSAASAGGGASGLFLRMSAISDCAVTPRRCAVRCAREVVAMAPALTIGFIVRSALSSIARTDSADTPNTPVPQLTLC